MITLSEKRDTHLHSHTKGKKNRGGTMFCTFYDERCMEFLLMASVFSMKSMYSFDIHLLNACYKPETLQSTLSREQESDYTQDTSPSSGKTLLIN